MTAPNRQLHVFDTTIHFESSNLPSSTTYTAHFASTEDYTDRELKAGQQMGFFNAPNHYTTRRFRFSRAEQTLKFAFYPARPLSRSSETSRTFFFMLDCGQESMTPAVPPYPSVIKVTCPHADLSPSFRLSIKGSAEEQLTFEVFYSPKPNISKPTKPQASTCTLL